MAGAKQRLKQYIEAKGITEYVFCKKNNLSNGYFNTGENVNSDKLHVIKSNFPDLDISWVITGDGSMFVDTEENEDLKALYQQLSQESSNVAERIELLIKELGYNKNSFSKAIGLTNNVTIGNIVNNNRQPSFGIIERIILSFENVNANWLITGKGEIFLNNKPSVSDSEGDIQEVKAQLEQCKSKREELEARMQICMQEKENLQDRLGTSLKAEGKLEGKLESTMEVLAKTESLADQHKTQGEISLQENGMLKERLADLEYTAFEMLKRLKKHRDIDGLDLNALSA